MLVPLLALLQLAQLASGPAEKSVTSGGASAASGGASAASTVVYSGVRGEIDVAVPRLELDVEIDGVLDEAAWADASVLTGFSQYRPVDGLVRKLLSTQQY